MKKTLFLISIFLGFSKILFSQVITDGLIGYWPLDGNTNESIYGKNGTIVSATTGTNREGSANMCYSFDGVDDMIWVAQDSIYELGTQDMSFSLWVKADSAQTTLNPGLIYHGATSTSNTGYWLRIVPATGVVGFSVSNGTTRTSGYSVSGICDNTWHHVALTLDRDGQAIIYIDGENDTQNGGFSISQYSNDNIQRSIYVIFGYLTYFKGSLDEIMIFNRVLTSSEIQQLSTSNTLTVNNGTGSGVYLTGETTNISANTPSGGYIFDHWTGDVSYLADTTAEQTTVTIPAQNITVSAVYKLIWNPVEKSVYYTGDVAIGREDVPDGYDLAVDGKIVTKEIKVTLDNWSDFVFDKDYSLMSIELLKDYIEQNGHLPSVPTEEEVKEAGISVGEMNAKLLQKIEEMTLYIITLNDKINQQQKEIELLKKKKGVKNPVDENIKESK